MTTCIPTVKRKISVPPAVQDALKYLPQGQVVRLLDRYPAALTVVPIEPKKGWTEVTLEGAGCLTKFTDHQLRNLLMITYLANPPEFCYRNFVVGLYKGAKWEVPLKVGIVDVMTSTHVIEVKVATSWKHALGQVLAYAHVTGMAPMVALFGHIPTIARDIFLVQGIDILEL